MKPPLLADYDGDGCVDGTDVVSYIDGKWVYFWANDDTWKGDNAFTSSSGRNAANGVVDGRNDLVNFLPIAVDVSAFVAKWGAGNVRYRIEPFFESMGGAKLALADVEWSDIGDAALGDDSDLDGHPLHSAKVHELGSGTNLPPAFVAMSQTGRSTMLMEFPVVSGYGRLELKIISRSDGSVLYTESLPLNVGSVDNMIGWVNIRQAAGGSGGMPTRIPSFDWPPETAREPGTVVFVHGYNMEEGEETRDWARNVFKKLWWAGSRKGFVAVQWRGNEGQLYVPLNGWVTPNYYGNVQNAFQTASALKTAMDAVPGPKWFVAHSLGNMLVSAARQDCGMPYEKYFMLNAAVAMEAFDPAGGITTESHDNMTPGPWVNYADRIRATHWFERFPEGDGRRLLTWKGRFSGVTDIVNFYSTQEEVVCNGDGQPKDLAREYSWYNQETRKGRWPTMLHEFEGGWEFNGHYDTTINYWVGGELVTDTQHMTPAQANVLSDAQLRQKPFFLDFYNPEMYSSSNGVIVADNYLYRAEMLAYAIPSESYAVGANPLPGLVVSTNATTGVVMPSRNHNMAMFVDGQEDLPVNGSETKDRHRDWQHSTFVQRSYKRTRRLFREIMKYVKGEL